MEEVPVQPEDVDGGVAQSDVEDVAASLGSYKLYAITVTEGYAGLQVIHKRLFVVQGWDAKNHCMMVRSL
jgi:hypothetical protein